MPSRRDFLATVAAGAAVSSLRPDRALAADRPEIKTALNGPVGLQLWSLRKYLPKDLPGTLAQVRAMGFREVEGAGLWRHSVKCCAPPSRPAPRSTTWRTRARTRSGTSRRASRTWSG